MTLTLPVRRNVILAGIFAFAFFALQLIINSGSAYAATKTWAGAGGNNNWSTSGNWSPSGAPVDGDSLVFNLSSLGANGNPINDIVGLSVASMSFSGGTQNQLFSVSLAEDTTLTGNVTSTSPARVSFNGGLILGSNVEFSGPFTFDDYTGGLNLITLGSNTLTISNYATGIVGIGVPISGSGTVNYEDLGSIQINSVNTYSGTTTFTNVGSVTNTTSDPQSPSEMFGTSNIVIDADSEIWLEFSASETFSNQITLAATTVNGNAFSPQLAFNSSQVSATHAITVPNVILTGAGGMTLSPSGIASVNLAGMQSNGNCLYVPTVYEEEFLNVASFCGASGADFGDTNPSIPGVPDAGSYESRTGILVAAGAVITAIGLMFVAKHKLKRD